jgi:hypothetical protein
MAQEGAARTNGVTILMGGRVLLTQEPIQDDNKFVHQVMTESQNWIKEGRPASNQPYLK